jgi:hypothetical protein
MAPSKPNAGDDKKAKAPKKRASKGLKKSPAEPDEVWIERAAAAAAGAVKLPSDEEVPDDIADEVTITEMLVEAAEAPETDAPDTDGKSAASSKSAVARGPTNKGKKKVTVFHLEDWNNMMFQALVYRAEQGDLNVGAKDEARNELFQWMQEQRRQFKLYTEDPSTSTLTADQVKVLDSLHFHWHTRGEEHWNRNYLLLVQFHRENGHCLVPRLAKDKLGEFVTEQRRQMKFHKEGKPSRMTTKRKARLDELGFIWQLRQRSGWDERYNELVQFKEQYGDTMVPQLYSANRALGKWVAKQREQHRLLQTGRHSFLTPDRLKQLTDIGFVWHVQGPGRPGRHTRIVDPAPAVDSPAVPHFVRHVQGPGRPGCHAKNVNPAPAADLPAVSPPQAVSEPVPAPIAEAEAAEVSI